MRARRAASTMRDLRSSIRVTTWPRKRSRPETSAGGIARTPGSSDGMNVTGQFLEACDRIDRHEDQCRGCRRVGVRSRREQEVMSSSHEVPHLNLRREADVGGLGQDVDMPAQLVLRGRRRDRATFDLVRNDASRPPASFEDIEHDVRIPRFGGAALLRAAVQARDHGFDVRRFEFGGQGGHAAAGEITEGEVSAEVLEALERGGLEGAQGVLHNNYRSFIISGVVLYSPSTRVVTLRRNGVLIGQDDDALWLFVHAALEGRGEA